MPESINPFDRKKGKAATPPPSGDKKQELLNRATGKPVLPTPPPAQPTPGITGNPPLPTGRVVGHQAPSSYTKAELDALAAVGVDSNVELPKTHEGLKQLQQVIAQHNEVEVPLPVPLTQPPVKPNTVPLSSLPAEDQKRITGAMAAIKNITNTERAAAASAERSSEFAAREGRAKGLGQATMTAEQSVQAFREKMAAKTATEPVYDVPLGAPPAQPAPDPREEFIKDYVRQDPAVVEASVGPPKEPPYEPKAAAVSDTGAHAGLSNCPHCNWDLADVDVPEPPYQDKMGFMHSMLGLKPFTKSYTLFGGLMEVTFRTLTLREVDVVYKQTYADKEEGKTPTDLDFWERLNRYRLLLQLHTVRTGGKDGIYKELPDGYSAATNNTATGYWVSADQERDLGINKTGLPDIEEWLIDEILKTEQVFRTVNMQCNQFNRLCSKMEVMVDNSDFWKPTEARS